jgi:hypothetical protein
MNRRTFLSAAAAVAAAGEADVSGCEAQAPTAVLPSPTRTILAVGAHYDDSPFGIPGTLLQAVAQGHRVVVLAMIGDYSNWKPVRGRGPSIVDGTTRINAEYGVESRFLPWASGKLQTSDAHRRAASELSTIALHLGDRVLADPFAPYATPRRTYMYDNGPRHTIGFVPDTFVDVTREWPRAIEWLGKLMALTRNEPYAAGTLDGAQRLKESLARYRGATCGVQYAEALSAANAYPQSLF